MAAGVFGTNLQPGGVKQVAIQPTGTPGSTYVRPQQKEAGGNLSRLADALGSLNGALQNYGSVSATAAKKEREDPDSESNRAFSDSIAGMSMEEAMATSPDAKNRIQKDSILTLVGSKGAYEFRQYLTEEYNNGGFDQNNGDFNSWAEEKRKEFADRLPDQAMQAAFFKGTDSWMQQFGEIDLKRKVEGALVERDTAVVDEFRMIADDGIARVDDPSKIANDIVNQSSQNRQFRGLDGRSQNATLYRLAEEYANNGEVELAKAILEHDRGGIGPLNHVSEYTDKAIKLIAVGESRKAEKQDAESFKLRTGLDDAIARGALTEEHLTELQDSGKAEWLTPAYASNLLQQSKSNKATLLAAQAKDEGERRIRYASTGQKTQATANAYGEMEKVGGAQNLQDVEYMGPTGETKVYTAAQQQKDVVARKLTEFQEIEKKLVENNVDPKQARETAMQARVAWFDGNSIPDDDLSKKFSSLFTQASVSRSLDKGEVTAQLAAVADEYQLVADMNPAYAETLVKNEKAKVFLENYHSARGSLMGKEDALIHAAVMSNRTAPEVSMGTLAPDEVKDLTDDVFDDLDGDATPNRDNKAWVADQLNTYTRRGMDPDAAKERVLKTLKDRSFEINGNLIINDGSMPADTPELLEAALKDRFEVFGKAEGIPDWEDLYVEEYASGQYLVMSKSKGRAQLGKGSRIDARELSTYRGKETKRRKDLSEAARSEDAVKRKAARDEIFKDIEADRSTVERWEKRAKSGRAIPGAVAKRLRSNFEKRLLEFNKTPETPIEKRKKLHGRINDLNADKASRR